AWMVMLRDYGTLELGDVLAPAIHYAEVGHPLLRQVSTTIAGIADFLRTEGPTSAAVRLPGGEVPSPGSMFGNLDPATTGRRLLQEVTGASSRETRIEAARTCFYRGFIAEAIDTYLRDACVTDATGERRKGVLTGEDMAGWTATREAPLSTCHAGWKVWKC